MSYDFVANIRIIFIFTILSKISDRIVKITIRCTPSPDNIDKNYELRGMITVNKKQI